MLKLSGAKLKPIMLQVFRRQGVNPESAQHVVDSIVTTSLRGVDSHGIQLFPHYSAVIDTKRVNREPKFRFESNQPSSSTLWADFGFGHHAGAVAMEKSIELCRKTGVGLTVVRNSTHFGAAAYFGLMAAQKDFLGIAMTNADALVKAQGAKESFFGTNPWCFTAPLENESPFCLDMATSHVSWNKIRLYREQNSLLPEGWAFDASGKPTTDPHLAVSLRPTGDYKGFGLGFMVEIFCGLLADGPIGHDILPMFKDLHVQRSVSHAFMSIDIGAFLETKKFKTRLQGVVDKIRSLSALDENVPVMVPGDPEKKTYRQRVESGIPFPESRFQEFLKIEPRFQEAVLT